MELIKDKHKREGLIGTVLFHVLLLILFIFAGLTYTVPPPEYGMLVNFGTSEVGSGEVQPETSGDPVAEEVLPEPVEATPEVVPETPTPTPEKVMTQTVEDAPEIEEQPKEEPKEVVEEVKPKEEVKEKPKEEVKPKISNKLSNAFNKLKNAKTSKGGSHGDDKNKTGDKGQPNGSMDPGAFKGIPGDGGNGSYYLGGRKAKLIMPEDDSQEEGIVVVDIIVDRTGRVLKAYPGAKGSTTTSAKLYRKAKEAALKTKFTPKPDAPLEQKGQIKYHFILG